jgi:NAD(P)-dependent dehydrogenase (short-subunit alcohol dehydrogenase family)
MIQQQYGRIINIASLSSFLSLSEVTAYCVSKSGVAMLTKCLACEWAKYGVNVNAIAPGVFRTDLNAHLLDGTPRGQHFLSRTPKGRFGNVEELQGAAIFLASDAAEYITGDVLAVDGGYLSFGV